MIWIWQGISKVVEWNYVYNGYGETDRKGIVGNMVGSEKRATGNDKRVVCRRPGRLSENDASVKPCRAIGGRLFQEGAAASKESMVVDIQTSKTTVSPPIMILFLN